MAQSVILQHLVTTKHSSTKPNAGFSGGPGAYDPGASDATNDAQGNNPALLNDSPAGTYEQADDATGMTTATAEALDDSLLTRHSVRWVSRSRRSLLLQAVR